MAVHMTKRKRRKFTPEFKAETIQLVRESNKTIAEIARDLELTESALRNWVAQAEVDAGQSPAGALTTSEREELARLRRENKVLQQERSSWTRSTTSDRLGSDQARTNPAYSSSEDVCTALRA